MTLRIGELTELDHGPGDVGGAEHARPPQALCRGERGLDIWHFDVEGDVPG
jgi:hypothetical protein